MDAVSKTTGAGQPADARSVRSVVQDHHPITGLYGSELGWFPQQIADDLLRRLDHGEAEYGHPLKVGWEQASQEIYQELLDAVLYAISAKNWTVVQGIMLVLPHVRGGSA